MPDARIKRTRSVRSCLSCRKAKQRCHLPDLFIEPSTTCALSRLNSCSRCNSLDLSCFVVDKLPKTTQRTLKRSRRTGNVQIPDASASTIGTSSDDIEKHAEQIFPTATSHTLLAATNSDSISSSEHGQRHFKSAYKDRSVTPTSGGFRIFDPLPSLNGVDHETKDDAGNRRQSRLDGVISNQESKSNKDWVDIGVTACRPFQLLDHILLRYNLPSPPMQSTSRVEVIELVPDLRERYETIAAKIRGTILFLPSFDDARADVVRSDLLLCAVLCLSWENNLNVEGKAETLSYLRHRCFSCILHSTHNLYDIYAIFIVALHLPPLFGPNSNSYSLDGLGLLGIAISAARLQDLDRAARFIENSYSFDRGYAESSDVPVCMISKACLWISLCLHAEYVALAGSGSQRPLATCSQSDIKTLQDYSDAMMHARDVPLEKRQSSASISLLIFRAQAVSETREISQTYTHAMDSQIKQRDTASCIANLKSIAESANEALQSSSDKLKTEGRRLVSDYASCGWTHSGCLSDFTLNLLNLQLLGLSRFAEKLLEHSTILVGPTNSSAEFLKRLLSEESLLQIYVLICGHRVDVAKHFLTLFINTRRRHSLNGIASKDKSQMWNIPSIYLCSSIVMAVEQIVEEVAGRIMAGHSLDKFGDCMMEMNEIILGDVYDCLLSASNVTNGGRLPQAKQAILDGNLLAVSAKLVDMLLQTLKSWNAAMDPFAPSVNATVHRTDINARLDFDLQQLDDLTPEGFENLFQEFLSTPLDFFSSLH